MRFDKILCWLWPCRPNTTIIPLYPAWDWLYRKIDIKFNIGWVVSQAKHSYIKLCHHDNWIYNCTLRVTLEKAYIIFEVLLKIIFLSRCFHQSAISSLIFLYCYMLLFSWKLLFDNILLCIYRFQLASACYAERIDLSAHGFYITPDIGFDWKVGKGNPFRYFTYGAAFAEVEIDTLTGDFHTREANVILDLGHSLNPAIDVGQVSFIFVFF